MLRRYFLVLLCSLSAAQLWGEEILKTPLQFVASDSIVVWGGDPSDIRSTALEIAPNLSTHCLTVAEVDEKHLKKDIKVWQKEVLPAFDITGGMLDEDGAFSLMSTSAVVVTAGNLFLQTADAQYIDVIERSALNALLAQALVPDMSFEKYQAAKALMNVSGMIYATDQKGLYVNLYLNSSAHIKTSTHDFVLEQLTAMPHSGRVKLRMGGLSKGRQPILLRLRMPDWACRPSTTNGAHWKLQGTPAQAPKIYVNGREEHYPMVGGYLMIDRLWNNGDEVFFDFPFHVQQLHPVKGKKMDSSLVAFQRGPLVYGFLRSVASAFYQITDPVTEKEVPNVAGHSVLSVPVATSKGDDRQLLAEPYMDGGQHLWIKAVGTDK